MKRKSKEVWVYFNPSDKMEWEAVKQLLFIAQEIYAHANGMSISFVTNFSEKDFWNVSNLYRIKKLLSGLSNNKYNALFRYLVAMLSYYMCWNDNSQLIKTKISLLLKVKNYYNKWSNQLDAVTISKECKYFINTSINSLENLNKLYNQT